MIPYPKTDRVENCNVCLMHNPLGLLLLLFRKLTKYIGKYTSDQHIYILGMFSAAMVDAMVGEPCQR